MILGLIAVALLSGASFAPESTNAPSCTRIVPANCRGYALKPAEGMAVFFVRKSADSDVLIGPRPWVGHLERAKGVIRIWPDQPNEKAIQTGAMFVKGQLVGFAKNGVDYVYPKGNPAFHDTLEGLWPEKRVRETTKGSKGDIWQGSDQRLRLWFVNPNSAGFLGVELMLMGLVLALGVRLWRKILGAIVCFAGVLLVALSGSRGAIVAALVGSVVALFPYRRRLLTRTGLVTVFVCVALSLALLGVTGQFKRVVGTFTHIDSSNGLRVKVALASARMFADAPLGWHGGEVPGRSACLNWYVNDEKHIIRTHFLTLAERGWPVGFGYVFFWVLMLYVGTRFSRCDDRLTLPLWSAFAAAGFFNPVYTEGSLWCLPAVCTTWAAWRHGKCLLSAEELKSAIVRTGAVSALFVVAFAVCGVALNRDRRISVKSSGAATAVNGLNPRVWVVEDLPVLGGWNGFPGRDVLWQYRHKPDLPPIGYVYQLADLPQEVECLVLPGRAAADYLAAYEKDASKVCHAQRLLFLSPSVSPMRVPSTLLKASDVFWLAGKFLSYRDGGYRKGLPWVRVFPGAEQYIPNWLSIPFRHFGYIDSGKQPQKTAQRPETTKQEEAK